MSPLRLAVFVFLIVVTLIGPACAHRTATMVSYAGVITRIEQPSGDYFSPVSGQTGFTRITISLATPSSLKGEAIKLAVMGPYAPLELGKIGERVTFRSSLAIPMSRELPFRSIFGYRVARRVAND